MFELLEKAVEAKLPVLLIGETGTGKTHAVKTLASKNGKKYTRIGLTGETSVDEFVGRIGLKSGETHWQDGVLLQAMKKGHYLLIDEVNAALPEILFVLHQLH